MFVPVPGLSAPLPASALSVALPKALKKELINVAFLDLLGNHVQSASFFRSIARSIAHPIVLPKICGLYREPELGARISRVNCRKSCDNIPIRDNLNIRVAIYII